MRQYPGAWKYHCQYLPVKQCETTRSRTNQLFLELQGGKKMASQSYVHLDHFFEIEARYLVSWSIDRRSSAPVGPTADSLDVLRAKLMQFASGGVFRKASATIPSPLDKKRGLPACSKEVQLSITRGQTSEETRRRALATMGMRIWTGLERGAEPAL
jgi:hypothetical protein